MSTHNLHFYGELTKTILLYHKVHVTPSTDDRETLNVEIVSITVQAVTMHMLQSIQI